MPFLRGREFSVSLLGSGAEARVLGTNEILYEAGSDFQGSDVELYGTRKARALGATTAAHGAGDGDADTDTDVIRGAAEALALEAWRAIGCRDAGRVDVRCQGTGEEDAQPMVLEVSSSDTTQGKKPEASRLD
jgi:D-alanine-D-alanine ligase